MIFLCKSTYCQVTGFTLASIAWIYCSASIALPQWQVWYFKEPMASKSSMEFVGLWRACVYHHYDNSSNVRLCHPYTFFDTFIPMDIRIAQHLLVAASILGLLGTVFSMFALRNVYTGSVQNNLSCKPFVISAILNITASSFLFLTVLCNYFSVIHKKGIAFPASFHVPSSPDTQNVGIAMGVGSPSAIMFLLSGIIFISYIFPRVNKVFPEV